MCNFSQRTSIINDELETGMSSSIQSRQMAKKSVQITSESFSRMTDDRIYKLQLVQDEGGVACVCVGNCKQFEIEVDS